NTVISNGVQVSLVDEARACVILETLQPPEPLALGDIAAARCFYGNRGPASHATGHRNNCTFAPDRRSINSRAKSFAHPKLLACVGIITGQTIGKTDDQLVVSAGRNQHWCAPGPAHAATAPAASAGSAGSAPAALTTRSTG